MKQQRKVKPIPPVPADFAVVALTMPLYETAKHYRKARGTVKLWITLQSPQWQADLAAYRMTCRFVGMRKGGALSKPGVVTKPAKPKQCYDIEHGSMWRRQCEASDAQLRAAMQRFYANWVAGAKLSNGRIAGKDTEL